MRTIVTWTVLLVELTAIGQINPNQTKPEPPPNPTKAGGMAAVRVEWAGSAPAKLYLNRQQVLLVPGKTTEVRLKPDLYEVEVHTPQVIKAKEYLAISEPSGGVLHVSVAGGNLITKYLTKAVLNVLQSIESNMVRVEGGRFQMGCTSDQGECDGEDSADEAPVHWVSIGTFRLCRYEVTQEVWEMVMGATVREHLSRIGEASLFGEGNSYPIYGVSWDDTQTFIRKLNDITDLAYRLPTEAEWEFAARGGIGDKSSRYAGGNTVDAVGWVSTNSSGQTHPVGQLGGNELGLFDMTGNVYEWCSNWLESYSGGKITWGDLDRQYRALRGSSFMDTWAHMYRIAARHALAPEERSVICGFRLARSE